MSDQWTSDTTDAKASDSPLWVPPIPGVAMWDRGAVVKAVRESTLTRDDIAAMAAILGLGEVNSQLLDRLATLAHQGCSPTFAATAIRDIMRSVADRRALVRPRRDDDAATGAGRWVVVRSWVQFVAPEGIRAYRTRRAARQAAKAWERGGTPPAGVP